MFDKIKKALRLTGTALDGSLLQNIESCLDDLRDQDIDTDKIDVKVEKAVELYCKWQFNFNGEADRYERNYRAMLDQMSMQKRHRRQQKNEG